MIRYIASEIIPLNLNKVATVLTLLDDRSGSSITTSLISYCFAISLINSSSKICFLRKRASIPFIFRGTLGVLWLKYNISGLSSPLSFTILTPIHAVLISSPRIILGYIAFSTCPISINLNIFCIFAKR